MFSGILFQAIFFQKCSLKTNSTETFRVCCRAYCWVNYSLRNTVVLKATKPKNIPTTLHPPPLSLQTESRRSNCPPSLSLNKDSCVCGYPQRPTSYHFYNPQTLRTGGHTHNVYFQQKCFKKVEPIFREPEFFLYVNNDCNS